MAHELDKVLISRDRIQARVAELGSQLAADLARELEEEGHDAHAHPDRIVMIPVLTGAIVFAADLIRHMEVRLSIRVVAVQSYPGESTASKGAKLASALPDDLKGRHVVIIDDILDSGQTLALLQSLIREQEPASLRSVMLLDKRARREVEVSSDYVGFEIPDEFVVGYGLDFDGYYRNLPEIMTLKAGA